MNSINMDVMEKERKKILNILNEIAKRIEYNTKTGEIKIENDDLIFDFTQFLEIKGLSKKWYNRFFYDITMDLINTLNNLERDYMEEFDNIYKLLHAQVEDYLSEDTDTYYNDLRDFICENNIDYIDYYATQDDIGYGDLWANITAIIYSARADFYHKYIDAIIQYLENYYNGE